MGQLSDLLSSVEITPTTIIDIALTALLIYGLFSLIRDTRAVRLVIGVTLVYGVYVAAQFFGLQLLSQILQAGAVVGLFALVVVFQPELRRALERLGRVGSMGWLLSPGQQGVAERVAAEVALAATGLAADRHGALIVLERETGLEDTAETGIMLHADLSAELLRTIFVPRSSLHDGAVIIRADRIIAAGAVLPLSEAATPHARMGTRHRAALGISEGTDALVVVVSEETGSISLVERGRIVRSLDQEKLRVALVTLLRLGLARRADALGLGGRGRPRRTRPSLRRTQAAPTSAELGAGAATDSAGSPGPAVAGAAKAGPATPGAGEVAR
jgi:diadenylate cyclase